MSGRIKKHLLFDFDGVIGDTYADNWHIVKDLHPDVHEMHYRIDHHLGNVFEEPRVPFSLRTTVLYKKRYNEVLSVNHISKAVPALRELGTHMKLSIVSSNCEIAIRRALQDAGVENLFTHILGATFHPSKVEKFKHIGMTEGFSLHDSLYVTDTLGDIKEASKVGLPTLAVTFGYHPQHVLSSGNPHGIAHSWNEVVTHAKRFLLEEIGLSVPIKHGLV